ncbi:hypothetical protein RRG08_032511 [Elysia crispata]|uniref:Uncharacterized protein n=1 Tax=Elysia crispata TaxID=231223 RepID=A0AAE1DP11_9GAST|nr:hypothetical protein RRG08_032511 [Elysia crispata]
MLTGLMVHLMQSDIGPGLRDAGESSVPADQSDWAREGLRDSAQLKPFLVFKKRQSYYCEEVNKTRDRLVSSIVGELHPDKASLHYEVAFIRKGLRHYEISRMFTSNHDWRVPGSSRAFAVTSLADQVNWGDETRSCPQEKVKPCVSNLVYATEPKLTNRGRLAGPDYQQTGEQQSSSPRLASGWSSLPSTGHMLTPSTHTVHCLQFQSAAVMNRTQTVSVSSRHIKRISIST